VLLQLADGKNGVCAAGNKELRQLVGFKGLGAEPYLDTISVIVLDKLTLDKIRKIYLRKDDFDEIDLYTLFIRRPPYEPETYPPIVLKNNEIILGSYIWFVKPEKGKGYLGNWTQNSIVLLNQSILQGLASSISIALQDSLKSTNVDVKAMLEFFDRTGIIGYGRIEDRGMSKPRVELKVLLIPSLLEHVASQHVPLPEVRAELMVESGSKPVKVNIVYGLDTALIKADKRFRLVEQQLRKSYASYQRTLPNGVYYASRTWLMNMIKTLAQYATIRSIRYEVGNFNYVSYCASSRYMTTFPLAPKADCPICKSAKKSICVSKFNGQLFHWRRQAFPKVYARFNSEASIHKVVSSGIMLPFSAVDLDGVKIHLVIDGVDMFVPYLGKISIDFEVEFQELLRNTNGMFVLIPGSTVELLVDALVTSARQGCAIKDPGRSVNIFKLLLTKMLVRDAGVYDLASVLEINPSSGIRVDASLVSQYVNKIFNLQAKDLNDIYRSLVVGVGRQSREIREKITNYVGELLAHTIAHVLYILAREDPEIPEENIAYIYGVAQGTDPVERVAYAGIYERSKYGILQLNKEISYALKRQASSYCPGINTLTDAIHCMLLTYFQASEREYINMQKQNSLRSMASNALNVYPRAVTGYKPWLTDMLAKNIVEKLRELVKEIYKKFADMGFELDFSTFNFIVMNKKEDIKNYLVNFVEKMLSNKVPRDSIEDTIEVILKEALHYAILAEGPEYCLDGCYVNIHLEKMCTKSVDENLQVSWELLRLFLYLTGLLKSKPGSTIRPVIDCKTGPNMIRVTGSAIRRMIRQAARRVKIGSAYVNADAIKIVEELLQRGVSVSMVVDSRSCKPGSPDDPCDILKRLRQQYSNHFKYIIAGGDIPSTHEKGYVIDNLRIYTSWNFLAGTPSAQVARKGPVAQTYEAVYVASGEE